jgi:uncharacterized protein
MYEAGHGVLQDHKIAHTWYNIATANGEKNSRTDRDSLAQKMTPEDISKAQHMAKKCMESDYKECGY